MDWLRVRNCAARPAAFVWTDCVLRCLPHAECSTQHAMDDAPNTRHATCRAHRSRPFACVPCTVPSQHEHCASARALRIGARASRFERTCGVRHGKVRCGCIAPMCVRANQCKRPCVRAGVRMHGPVERATVPPCAEQDQLSITESPYSENRSSTDLRTHTAHHNPIPPLLGRWSALECSLWTTALSMGGQGGMAHASCRQHSST